MKKVHSFTLSELLVVLVISSIVVTISFLALNNVQKQIRNINIVFEKQEKINALERALNIDLNRHKGTYNKQKKELLFTGVNNEVKYRFYKKHLFRDSDSIALEAVEIAFYLDGERVDDGVIDALEFSFSSTYTEKGFFAYKRKDVSHYIN